jgi:hypothetical protein
VPQTTCAPAQGTSPIPLLQRGASRLSHMCAHLICSLSPPMDE